MSGGGRIGEGSALRSGRERREKATTESNWDRFIDEELKQERRIYLENPRETRGNGGIKIWRKAPAVGQTYLRIGAFAG